MKVPQFQGLLLFRACRRGKVSKGTSVRRSTLERGPYPGDMQQGETPDRIIFSLLDEPVIFARDEFAGAYGQRQFSLSGESFREAAATLNG